MPNHKNCSLSFNCQTMTGKKFDYCPNKYTCEEIAEQIEEEDDDDDDDYIELPRCSLFYEYNLDYKYLEFTYLANIPELAKKLGFEQPVQLPYQYFEVDVIQPELDTVIVNGVPKKYLNVVRNLLDQGFAQGELYPLTRRINELDNYFEYSEVAIVPPLAKLFGWSNPVLIPDYVEISKDKLGYFLYGEAEKLWDYLEAKNIYYLSYDWKLESIYKTENYLSTYRATGIQKFIMRAYLLLSNSDEADDFIEYYNCEVSIQKEKCLDIKSTSVRINPDLLVLNLTNSKPEQ